MFGPAVLWLAPLRETQLPARQFTVIQIATRDHWADLSRMLLMVDAKMAWVALADTGTEQGGLA